MHFIQHGRLSVGEGQCTAGCAIVGVRGVVVFGEDENIAQCGLIGTATAADAWATTADAWAAESGVGSTEIGIATGRSGRVEDHGGPRRIVGRDGHAEGCKLIGDARTGSQGCAIGRAFEVDGRQALCVLSIDRYR